MTLFEKVHELVNDDIIIIFSREINQLLILMKYMDLDGNMFQKKSLLPLQDHFYESKVVDCITWMEAEFKKEIK